MKAVLKIISGGQTGVDRGALDAALIAGIPCGGWCPAGRRAEDGVISEKYPVREMASANYSARTRQNVIDSDATLIIYFNQIEGGTAQTLEFCRKLKKPCMCLDATKHDVTETSIRINQFVDDNAIVVLNVAGPRASKQPQAQTYAAEILGLVISNYRENIVS